MIKFVFLDLDDTILDFHKAEQVALKRTLEHFNVPSSQDVLDLYHEINIAHWKLLEKGEITRAQVKTGRYEVLFGELGISDLNAEQVTEYYESKLAIGHCFIDGAKEMLEELCRKYSLFIVSNGAKRVQDSRLKGSGAEKYFENIFISETIGYEKPNVEFFKRCFSQIPSFNKQEAVIIGDSLSSDIKGGKNCGIKTIWFNKNNTVNDTDISPDYEIHSLYELSSLLGKVKR